MLDFEESVRVGTLPSGFFFSFFGRLSVLQSVLEFHQVLKTEQGEHTIVVSPQGEAFGFRYTDIQTEYNRIYQLFEQPEIKNLVVDFSQIEFIDSTFIGVCLSLAKKAKLCKGQSRLCGINENVRELLKKSQLIENDRFDFLWSECPTREDALAELEPST